jgi:hypothetical protein
MSVRLSRKTEKEKEKDNERKREKKRDKNCTQKFKSFREREDRPKRREGPKLRER